MTPDEQLLAVVTAVAERFEWGGFRQDGSVLTRTSDAGVDQLVHFYRNYGGPPEGQGGVLGAGRDTSFQVELAAKLLPGSQPRRPSFTGRDMDVDINIGQTRRAGFHPDFALAEPESSSKRVVALLEPYGRRWFQRFESLERGVSSLEQLPPTAALLAGDHPALIAMRLRAAQSDWDAVTRNLEAVVAGPSGRHPVAFLRVVADYACSLGLPADELPASFVMEMNR